MQRWVVEKVPREEQEEECSFQPTPFCEDFKVDQGPKQSLKSLSVITGAVHGESVQDCSSGDVQPSDSE